MNGRSGFWSYVRDDDADEGGRISELAGLFSRRVRLLTGQSFPIFLDHESIGWGDDWESRIDEALIATTFFVPILTPSYFRSESCRKELLRFSSTATALGLEELILPIYYVAIPELESPPPSGDDLIDLVRRYQWVDWRDTALEDRESSAHRKQVDALAQQLLRRAAAADAKPAVSASAGSQAREHGAGHPEREAANEDEEPGVLEVLAEGEQALPRLSQLMEAYLPIMKEMSSAANEGTQRLKQSDGLGKGFGGRLLVGKWLANKWANPAEQLEKLAAGFLEELLKIDPMIVTIFQLARAAIDDEERAAIVGFVKVIQTMADAAEEGLGAADSLATVVHENSNWSKDLRKPMQRIERALRQFADARAVFRQWKAQSFDLLDTIPDGRSA